MTEHLEYLKTHACVRGLTELEAVAVAAEANRLDIAWHPGARMCGISCLPDGEAVDGTFYVGHERDLTNE